MNVRGYEFPEWLPSSTGKIAFATKDGKKYFLKRYVTPACPVVSKAVSPKLYEANKAKFDKFVRIRQSISSKIRSFAPSGGDIIVPVADFIDDNHFVEVSDFINDKVDDDDLLSVLNSLTLDVKRNILITAVGALKTVHAHNIVHSDLKLKNILLVKNRSGGYSAKLIDFDNSYFVGDLPDEVMGDIAYYSPELGRFNDAEDADERAMVGKELTTKSDIFSLGLIFHYYLSGERVTFKNLPRPLQARVDNGKPVYAWAVALYGGEIVLSPKIKDANLRSLISDMLLVDKEKRPSATDVIARIKGLGPKPDTTITTGPTIEPKKEEPKKEDKTPVTGFDDAWDEHNITVDYDFLKRSGYVAFKQATLSSAKGYYLYRNPTGTPIFRTASQLIMQGYAKSGKDISKPKREEPKVEEPEKKEEEPVEKTTVAEFSICDPFPEHNIAFVEAKIKEQGINRIERYDDGRVKAYKLIKTDGTSKLCTYSTCILLGIAVRK